MRLVTRDYKCNKCSTYFYLTVEREEEDKPQRCPNCDETSSERALSAPNVVGKASYLDGQSRGRAYDDMKMASKLEKQVASLPHEERKEIKQEIKKLKKVDS